MASDLIRKDMAYAVVKDYFKQKIDKGEHEVDVVDCNADLQVLLFEQPTIDRWTPCNERRPGFKDGISPIFEPTLVTTRNKKGGLHVTVSNFCILTKRWLCEVENKDIKVIAWMPKPKPYEEEEE